MQEETEETTEVDMENEDSEGEDETPRPHIPKKVEITITDRDFEGNFLEYSCDDKLGQHFVSVDYMANTYGGCSPCDTDEQISRAVEWAKHTILKEGDIPIVRDVRDKNKLLRWCV